MHVTHKKVSETRSYDLKLGLYGRTDLEQSFQAVALTKEPKLKEAVRHREEGWYRELSSLYRGGSFFTL